MGLERGHRAGGTTSIDTRIIESTPDGFWMSDESGRILEVNEVYCRMTGYSREELLSSFVWDLEANESAEEVRRHIEYVREHGGHGFETRHRRRDGTVVDVEVSVAHYPGTEGGFFSFVRDITKRKRAESDLLMERHRLSAILEGTNVGTWEWNVQTGETRFNERWANIVGYSLEELSPVSISTWEYFAHPDDLARSNELLQAHFAGESAYYDCEVRMRHRDGSWVWVRDRGRVADWSEDGRPLWIFGTHEDITERKALEQQRKLIIEERTALMRELNHRTKNNLAIVSSLITLKDNALGDTADLSDIRHQVEAIRIVHEKLQQSPENITHINLREYVGDLLRSVFALAHGGSVHVENRIGEVMMPTKSAVTLGLIINELATNALKYAFADDRENQFTVELETDDDQAGRSLVVSNTGAGFPDDIDLENASSLGLQLVSAMVRQMGGSISLEREPRTSFTIVLPADTH